MFKMKKFFRFPITICQALGSHYTYLLYDLQFAAAFMPSGGGGCACISLALECIWL